MIGALTYEEVLQATMRSNWIHALWLFAVVVLIWVCTILLTLYGNRKKKPKDKDDSWQVSVFLLVLVVIGYGICVGTSVPEENARIQQDIDEHAYVTVHAHNGTIVYAKNSRLILKFTPDNHLAPSFYV